MVIAVTVMVSLGRSVVPLRESYCVEPEVCVAVVLKVCELFRVQVNVWGEV